MRGAKVVYYLDNGKEVIIGGSFDVEHIFKIKERVERRSQAKVIGHSARWTYAARD